MLDDHRHTVVLPSGQVSYLQWPSGAAADRRGVIVLLHGGGFDNAVLSWGGVGPCLAAAGWRVLAPDLPGFGNSPLASWPATQENLIQVVAEFVDALNLDKLVLGGISLGGGLTWGYGLAHPDRVQALIPCGAYGMMRYMSRGMLAGLAHRLTFLALRSGLLDLIASWSARNERLLRWGMKACLSHPESLTGELMAAVRTQARGPHGTIAFGQWQRSEFGWLGARHDYSPQFADFERPVLLVHGGKDRGVPAAYAGQALLSLPRGELVIVPDAGHWVQRDAEDEVVAAILQFLKRVG